MMNESTVPADQQGKDPISADDSTASGKPGVEVGQSTSAGTDPDSVQTQSPHQPEQEAKTAPGVTISDSLSNSGAARKNEDSTADEGKPVAFGARLKGTVVQVCDDCVEVDIGQSRRALIPRGQFSRDVGGRGDGKDRVGQGVEVILASNNQSNGHIHANLNGSVIDPTTDPLTPGVFVEGKITGMIKGGLEVQIGQRRAFMPASHADSSRLKDISILLGETTRCKILLADPDAKSIVVSRKKALDVERAVKRRRLFESLQVGDIRVGTVRNLLKYGAFVDLGGVHGLVHISDISWTPISSPAEALKVGQEVQVKVLKVSRDRGRVALGIKQTVPNPWDTVEKDFPPGTRLKARVRRLADFGAFVEVTKGVNGLIPLAEMCWGNRPNSAGEVVAVGQEVDLVVINVDAKRHRIGLSIKRTSEDPWSCVEQEYKDGATVTGRVSKILEFGALVELKPNVEGMIHISELAHERVRKTGDAVAVGEEVSVQVLSVDGRKRRIALSRKALIERPAQSAEVASKPKTKRKRVLRGGLDSHFQW